MIELSEASPPEDIRMPRAVAQSLVQLGVASVSPGADEGTWRVAGVKKVGALTVSGQEVRIRPKLPITRLMFLLGFANDQKFWRDEEVTFDEEVGLLSAVAHAYMGLLRAATSRGVLQGYRTIQSTEPVVRGRIDFTEQLKRRTGLPIPMEVTFDEFTVDIAENRVLLSAIDRLLRVSQLDPNIRRALQHHLNLFAGVALIPRGALIPRVRFDRGNVHYRSAFELGTIILKYASVEHRSGSVAGSGFLVNLSTVFEHFVTDSMRSALTPHGGRVIPQHRVYLDEADLLGVRPDITWAFGHQALAVLDAKYKAEKPSGYPIGDVYQMLAYCTRMGLRDGHLIYAAGEIEPTVHKIRGVEVAIHCHAIDLDGTPGEVLDRISMIADRVVGLARLEPARMRVAS